MGSRINGRLVFALAFASMLVASPALCQKRLPFVFPEARTIDVRDPSELGRFPIPQTPPPETVDDPPGITDPRTDVPVRQLTLDESIRSALANTEVVRVLTGLTASNSGRTVYDTAITNNAIDEQHATFDPRVSALNNTFNRIERPEFFGTPPTRVETNRRDNYDLDVDLTKTTITGGTFDFGVNTNPSRVRPFSPLLISPLFPPLTQNRSSAEFMFTQPLLQGGGIAVNLAPIVLARIDTERSYFQFKASMQELVRSVIDSYWQIVFARTDLWAREQQYEQVKFAFEQAEANFRRGRGNLGDVSLARTSLAEFRTALIASQANLLDREAAFRNLLGFPPYDPERIVPITEPKLERLEMDWSALLELTEQFRPDIIELKLILEADQQLLLQADNQAKPSVNAVGLYRWNGLEGELPNGTNLSSSPGQFTDWTLAVNFSVPLGLRAGRANLRRQELIISRDRANLQQGLHATSHDIALNLRNQAQFYSQYLASKEAREAARINLEVQLANWQANRVDFLRVLQAIVSWGNNVSLEAQSLLQYNTELANLESLTGTILETHGIRFVEERFESIGPLGRLHHPHSYPRALPPTLNFDQYPNREDGSENTFDLTPPESLRRKLRERIEGAVPRNELPSPSPNPNDGANGRPATLRWLD